jgi:hypothetical protein
MGGYLKRLTEVIHGKPVSRVYSLTDASLIGDIAEAASRIEELEKAMEGLVDDLERRHRQVAEVCDEMQQQANDGYSYHRLVGKQAAYHHAAELAYQARAALTGEDQ